MEAHERCALPEGWEWKGLGEILELIRNGISTKQNEEKEGYPVTRIETISKGKINREKIGYVREDYNTILKYKMISGDILFSHINSAEHIGKTAIFENESDELYQGVNLLLLRPNKDIIFPKYLLFYLKEPEVRKYFETRCKKAVNQASLNQKDIIQIKIPLPPLPTQRRIVSILEKAEETKRLRAQADELTDRLLQSVFLEMFGDSARNPNGWAMEKLGEVLSEDPQNGLYKPSTDYGGGTPILRIDSFYDGRITNIERLKRLRCNKDEIEKFKLKVGDIMINRVNSLEYLGKCGLVQNLFEDTVYESNMMRIRPRKDILNSTYLTAFLCTKYIKNQILSRAKKAVNQASINQRDVTSLPILLPPLPLQLKFARIVEKVESMRQSQNQSKQQIEDLFSALMQKAFRGEI